jgi:hypothetical protein
MTSLFHSINPLFVLSGFCVGALVGMTGVGGGSLMTPILILLFGIHPATAVGTDLLYAGTTQAGGTLVHGVYQTIEWRIVGRLAAGSIPATVLTIMALSHITVTGDGSHALFNDVLGVALLLTAIVLLFRRWILSTYAAYIGEIGASKTKVLTIAVGAALGGACIDFVSWSGRHRRHRPAPAISAFTDAADRWLGYCSCSAIDACWRDRPFDAGHRGLAHSCLSTYWLLARRIPGRALFHPVA